MKKLLVLLLALVLLGCLAACQESTPTEPQGTTTAPSTTQTPTTVHTHSYTETVTAPTCTAKGYTTYTCACGDSYSENEVAALGHDYSVVLDSTAKAASCAEVGKAADKQCSRCDSIEIGAEIAAAGHLWQAATVEAPKTCGTCGLTEGKALPDARFDPEKCASLFGTWVVERSDTIKETNVFRDDGLVFYLTEYNGQVQSAGYECYYVADNQLWIGYHWNEMRAQDYTLDGEKLTLNANELDEIKMSKTSDSMKRPADPEGKFDPEVCAPLFGTWETEMNGYPVHYIFTDSGEMYCVLSNGLDSMVAAYMTYYVVDGQLHTGMNWESQGSGPFSVEGNKLILYNEEAGEIMSQELSRVSDNMETPLMYVHSCDYIAEVTLPTCLKKGYTTYTCKLCGKTKKDDYTDRLPHEWEEAVTAPTCTSQGYIVYTCIMCGDGHTDYIDVLMHEYKPEIYTPSCTEKGYTIYTCVCGDSYVDSEVDATGHSCDENGQCVRCDYYFSVGPEYTLIYQDTQYMLTSIGNCMDTDIVIPEEYNGLPVTFIDYAAFDGCSSVISITIPETVTRLGGILAFNTGPTNIFSGCENLKEIVVDENNPIMRSEEGVLYSKDGETLIAYPRARASEFVIPDSVTYIGNNAFADCSSLTSITIPDSVTRISNDAFAGCSSLTSITIPDSVNFIAGGAFEGCSSLTDITIPHSVIWVCEGVFSGCSSLTSITIPDSVTSIYRSAFLDCSNLTSIYFEGTMEQWNAIQKGESWDENTGDYTVYCTDGEIKK